MKLKRLHCTTMALSTLCSAQSPMVTEELCTYHVLQGVFTVCFASTMDAVRFCHAVQIFLMYTVFPPETEHLFQPPVTSSDGRWVHHGPRMSLAIHRTTDYVVSSFCLFQRVIQVENSTALFLMLKFKCQSSNVHVSTAGQRQC
jgi:hypothetical protein